MASNQEIAWADLADEMGQAEITVMQFRGHFIPVHQSMSVSWYTHRLMHRKRVTSELHDSYFRLMTIKHAIPKIEWALNYYITRSRKEVRQLEIREDVVGKAIPGRRDPRDSPDGILETSW